MIRTKSFIPLFVAILLFLRLGPYFVWAYDSFYFSYGLTVLISLFFFLNLRKFDKKAKNLFLLYSVGAIVYGIVNKNAMVGLFVIFLGVVAFAKEDFNKKVFESFSSLYSVTIALGILSWILIMMGALSPIGTVESVSEDAAKQSGYILYPFTIMVANSDAIRFRGMFDEPGVVGSFSAILLCIKHFDFKDWRTYPLLLSGVISMSFYFYVVIFIYVSFSLLFIKRKPGYLFLIVTCVLGVFLLTKNNALIYELLWRRFEWDSSSGMFVGDNRMAYESDIAQFYDSIRGTRQYWFGVDNKKFVTGMLAESSSYKNAVMFYGMFFFLLYCLFFLVYGNKYIKDRKAFLLYSFVFLGMVYQRPGIYEPILLFLFTYYAGHPEALSNQITSSKLKGRDIV